MHATQLFVQVSMCVCVVCSERIIAFSQTNMKLLWKMYFKCRQRRCKAEGLNKVCCATWKLLWSHVFEKHCLNKPHHSSSPAAGFYALAADNSSLWGGRNLGHTDQRLEDVGPTWGRRGRRSNARSEKKNCIVIRRCDPACTTTQVAMAHTLQQQPDSSPGDFRHLEIRPWCFGMAATIGSTILNVGVLLC